MPALQPIAPRVYTVIARRAVTKKSNQIATARFVYLATTKAQKLRAIGIGREHLPTTCDAINRQQTSIPPVSLLAWSRPPPVVHPFAVARAV